MPQQFDRSKTVEAAKLEREDRAERVRFYIRLNPKPKRYDPTKEGSARWGYDVWPILFKTRELAEEVLHTFDVFRDGRHGSASVEVTLLPKKEAPTCGA